MSPDAAVYQARSGHGLLASCIEHAPALLLAREWLR